MKHASIIVCSIGLMIPALAAIENGSPARAADVPAYFKPIVGTETSSAAEIGTKNVLQLNTTMFELYGDAARIFQKNILAQHPVILGLFSGAGGRFLLYRPGQPPLDAPQVPIDYQLMKSVGHSTMALGEIVVPYVNSPNDKSWRPSMATYRVQNIAWAAQTQVGHWMNVISGWKQMLGADWDKTYAASNTIYVARQNNILFSVLAQFFGPEAINDRLMLIETISFTTTPDEMLDSLTRIISDRWVGAAFFGNYYTMDFELMGGDARQAIIDEDTKLKITPTLPPQVPFGSHQWPALITPGPGAKTLADLP